MIGLKNGRNLLFEYDPDWPSLCEEERVRLAGALEGIAKGGHYRSTSVPGLPSRPIPDILVGVSPGAMILAESGEGGPCRGF